jgi:hypothetical protein
MSSPHRFVVRQQVWTPPDAADIRRLLPEKWDRVAEFRTEDDAQRKYADLLADSRRTLNPFHLCGPCLFYQTSLPPHALHDFLLDGGIDFRRAGLLPADRRPELDRRGDGGAGVARPAHPRRVHHPSAVPARRVSQAAGHPRRCAAFRQRIRHLRGTGLAGW